MVVIAPCDVYEAKRATLAMATYVGPVYMRLARENTPIITTPASPFEIGKAELFMKRDVAHTKKVGIISTGTVTHHALVAAATLNEKGIGTSVLHMATIKPLDTTALLDFAKDHDVLVTVEEHQRMGGLGSAVAEYLSLTYPKRILRLGVDDVFGQSGTPEELLAYYGIDSASIVREALKYIG